MDLKRNYIMWILLRKGSFVAVPEYHTEIIVLRRLCCQSCVENQDLSVMKLMFDTGYAKLIIEIQ